MKYISILRGINVGGQKKIKMADPQSLYESLGFQRVVTCIQSGNVIFDADSSDKSELRTTIEKAIEEKYAFHAPVDIRTSCELADIVKNNPLGPVDLAKNGTKVLVTFLSAEPATTKIAGIQQYVAAAEQLFVIGKEVYLYCPNGYGKSKLSNSFLKPESVGSGLRKLGGATTRNWKSVLKLYELSL